MSGGLATNYINVSVRWEYVTCDFRKSRWDPHVGSSAGYRIPSKKVASYFFKNVLAILHARVSFYLHVKEDFKGIEKLFYVMNFHWLTNIHTIAFPPESSNSSR